MKRLKSGLTPDKEEILNLKKSQQTVDTLIKMGYIDKKGEPTKKAIDVSYFF